MDAIERMTAGSTREDRELHASVTKLIADLRNLKGEMSSSALELVWHYIANLKTEIAPTAEMQAITICLLEAIALQISVRGI